MKKPVLISGLAFAGRLSISLPVKEVGNINSSLGETASTTSNVASNVDTLKTNLTDVNTLVTDEQTTFSTLIQTINDIIEAINQKTTVIQEEQNAVGIPTNSEMADFLLLKEKILLVSTTLGAGIEGQGEGVTEHPLSPPSRAGENGVSCSDPQSIKNKTSMLS